MDKDRASFQGRFVNFPEMISNPKLFQKPYRPIIMGGAFPYGAQKAIEYSDGWLPHATRPEYGDLIHKLPDFKKMCNGAGRDPDTVPITVYGIADDPDLLKKYRDAGVERVVFAVPSEAGERLIPILDPYAMYNDQMK